MTKYHAGISCICFFDDYEATNINPILKNV
jgi:hypothetical protein